MGSSNVWMTRIGHGLSILVALLFLFSATMRFMGGEALEEGMAHLGLPRSMVMPVGILEVACVAIYLIPVTSVLGGILLTGYIGGIIGTHWRVGDLVVAPAVAGVAVGLGLYLRDRRLRVLLPLRRPGPGATPPG